MNNQDQTPNFMLPAGITALIGYNFWNRIDGMDKFLFCLLLILLSMIAGYIYYEYFSVNAKDKRKALKDFKEAPDELRNPNEKSILLGYDYSTKLPIYFPDRVRVQHTHIIGATGSGKTKSVILNFLRQDIERGLGAIILDAKGDNDFLDELKKHTSNISVFDLGSADSDNYNPLKQGNTLESAQRLMSSLTWTEDYYRIKSFDALERIFESIKITTLRNPTLLEISSALETSEKFSALVNSNQYPAKIAEKDFPDLSGLRSQIKILSRGYLSKTLSPTEDPQIELNQVRNGKVIYFRLQSLMSPDLASIMGRLVINDLNYLAGTAHRSDQLKQFVPVYLDEFATFVCAEFADLISKARSAGLALHFSHQSLGDLKELSDSFLSKLADNSATRMVLRINDPDSAEYLARAFGTKEYQKLTQRVTNSKDTDAATSVGEGTARDARQFKMGPDQLKTLPTGVGAVLVAHGKDTVSGGASVFKVRFPILN